MGRHGVVPFPELLGDGSPRHFPGAGNGVVTLSEEDAAVADARE